MFSVGLETAPPGAQVGWQVLHLHVDGFHPSTSHHLSRSAAASQRWTSSSITASWLLQEGLSLHPWSDLVTTGGGCVEAQDLLHLQRELLF